MVCLYPHHDNLFGPNAFGPNNKVKYNYVMWHLVDNISYLSYRLDVSYVFVTSLLGNKEEVTKTF